MKLESQVCSLELAKKLNVLGVKQESTFYWKPCGCGDETHHKIFLWSEKLNTTKSFSAFTVAELGEMLPYDWFSKKNGIEGFCCWESSNGYWNHYEDTSHSETEANARAKMLIHLIEKGIIKDGGKNES